MLQNIFTLGFALMIATATPTVSGSDAAPPDTITNTVSGSDAAQTVYVLEENNEEEIALLATAVDLLAENSSSVTGTLNASVLSLMDRMVDSYPSYCKYAGFRTSDNDSYASTLYIAKKATVDGNTITFSDDCIAITFNRYQETGYNSYIYYDVANTPNASVDVNSQSIVYTNCLNGYPALGTKSTFNETYFWILIAVILASILFIRRNAHD